MSKIGQPSFCSFGISRRLLGSSKIALASGTAPRIRSFKVLPAIGGASARMSKITLRKAGHECQNKLYQGDGFVPELPKPSDRKGPKMFETPRFSTVEAALVQTYRIPAR